MTNDTDRILLIMAEEAAEVAQAALKAVRFTLASENPYITNALTKREELIQELGDLSLLVELLGIDNEDIYMAKEYKIQKVLSGPKLDLKTILLKYNYAQK